MGQGCLNSPNPAGRCVRTCLQCIVIYGLTSWDIDVSGAGRWRVCASAHLRICASAKGHGGMGAWGKRRQRIAGRVSGALAKRNPALVAAWGFPGGLYAALTRPTFNPFFQSSICNFHFPLFPSDFFLFHFPFLPSAFRLPPSAFRLLQKKRPRAYHTGASKSPTAYRDGLTTDASRCCRLSPWWCCEAGRRCNTGGSAARAARRNPGCGYRCSCRHGRRTSSRPLPDP